MSRNYPIANWPLKIDVLKIHNCFTEITRGVSVNLFKISETSLTIRSYMHFLCRRAHVVRKALNFLFNQSHILCMGSKALY